jgi:outer membrane protein OmpA-like peptidoglycan-associated protein
MRTITLLLCLVAFGAAQAQQTNLDKLNWKQNLELANDLYSRNSFYNAAEFYEKVIRDKPDNLDARYKLAESYRQVGYYEKAENLYRFFTPADSKTYPLAVFYYATMLKANGKHVEAMEAFKIFVQNPNGADNSFVSWAQVQLKGCELYANKSNNSDITVKHAGGNINGVYPNFGAVYESANSIIFSSIVSDTAIVIRKGETTMPIANKLYRSKASGSAWSVAEPLMGLNGESHTANGSFSADGKLFFFTRCITNEQLVNTCGIFVSRVVNGEFEPAVKLPESVNRSGFSNTQPAAGIYNSGQQALYFASNRDGGKGGFDLWVVNYSPESLTFGNPVSLSDLNTPWDEVSPFYHVGSSTLYFSTDGMPGVGGLDVFSSQETEGAWAVVTHLDKPINTSADDWYYSLNKEGLQGFVSSNRPGSISLLASTTSEDIYTVSIKKTVNYYGYVYQLGDTNEIPLKDVTITLYEKNATTGKFEEVIGFKPEINAQGQFNIPLRAGNDYKMIATKPKYLNDIKQVSKQEIDLVADGKKFITFSLDKIEKDKVYKLDNIYYDYNSANLRDSSKAVLDGLLTLLTNNPSIVIELSSHTDSRGGADYNKTLSQERAESCVKYLIEKGIDPKRMVAVGYGEDKLLNDCGDKSKCTEEQHQVNRRTEFKVLGVLEEGNIIKQ